MRNATTSCKHFDFWKWCELNQLFANIFVFLHSIEMQYWVVFLIIIRQLYRITSSSYIRCDDDDSQWQRFIAFDAMTTVRNDDFVTSWFLEVKAKTSCWKFSNSSVSAFCNDNQQLQNVCLLISFARSFVFSKVCVAVRFETASFRQNRQKNRIDEKKQQYADIISFQMLWFSTFSSFCFFRARRSIQESVEYRWFIEHDQLRTFVFQMIDQLAQRHNFFARESIEASIACIVMLMFWIEIDSLTLWHAFCIVIEMIVQIWKIFFLSWFSWFSQRQWNQTV